MLRKGVLIAGFLAGFAVPAFAFQCPVDMSAIDKALEAAKLSDADLAKVKELRMKGEELHNAGNHAESVKTLGEAKTLLGIK